ncbi:MAG: DUF1837 domain-containing protein [Acidobacteria bacterium]|nr:DUF1837 domain-containing protein [Acidobacteriota bacterium]
MQQRTVKVGAANRRQSSHAKQTQAPSYRLEILGKHPDPPNLFGVVFNANDTDTKNAIFHRALSELEDKKEIALTGIRKMLIQHHASPQMWQATQQRRDAIARLGLGASLPPLLPLPRIPKNDDTKKCNLAETLLAEYLIASTNTLLPVYRLHHNPNYGQSMKGDDVLAFELNAEPIRIIVGEAKFRAASANAVVREIVESLEKSHKLGAPISLTFVGDHVADAALAERIYNCAVLFALNKIRLDYVGFLMSDMNSATRVAAITSTPLQNLAIITLGLETPTALLDECYRNLEDECLSQLT